MEISLLFQSLIGIIGYFEEQINAVKDSVEVSIPNRDYRLFRGSRIFLALFAMVCSFQSLIGIIGYFESHSAV